MIKAIPMEDWLRGCVYHDGRHGYVTLPTDKVHQIANYIQRTRRSGTDGLIDLEVVEADRKTEPQTCEDCIWNVCNYNKAFEDEPQTETQMKTQISNLTFEKADERCKGCKHYKLTCDLFSEICEYEPKDEPQTDCAWK